MFWASPPPLLKDRRGQEVGCGLGVVGRLLFPGSQGLLCFAVPSCLPAGPVMTGSCSLNPMCWKAKYRLLGLVWARHLCGESLWLLNRGLCKLRAAEWPSKFNFILTPLREFFFEEKESHVTMMTLVVTATLLTHWQLVLWSRISPEAFCSILRALYAWTLPPFYRWVKWGFKK